MQRTSAGYSPIRRSGFAEITIGNPTVAITPDLTTIAETARDLPYRQLDEQLQAGDNFDTKLVGILGFDGAALAAVLAFKDSLHGWWAVTTFGILLSSFFSAFAIRGVNWALGPYPSEFYDEATKGGVGSGSATMANLELVSETDAALRTNDGVLKRKARGLLLAVSTLVVTAIVTSALIGVR